MSKRLGALMLAWALAPLAAAAQGPDACGAAAPQAGVGAPEVPRGEPAQKTVRRSPPQAGRRTRRRRGRAPKRDATPPPQTRADAPPRTEAALCEDANRERMPEGKGLLAGTVSRGPTLPLEGPGFGSRRPAAGVGVVVATLDGREVGNLVTDAAGRYSLHLPPGTYRVALLSDWRRSPRARTAVVSEGRCARVGLLIDTGVR